MELHNKEKLQPQLDFVTTGEVFCYIHQAELRPRDDDNDDFCCNRSSFLLLTLKFFATIVLVFCYYRHCRLLNHFS